MSHNDIKSGPHLGVVHNYIKWHARNGERVTWGHHELLEMDLHVDDLERIAQDIRDAVLEEFHVKDSDHQYRYVLSCDEGCAAFQDFDTFDEMWAKLYKSRGRVMVMVRDTREWIFHGTTEEARTWCLAQWDEKEASK